MPLLADSGLPSGSFDSAQWATKTKNKQTNKKREGSHKEKSFGKYNSCVKLRLRKQSDQMSLRKN
jgi:hypothetical protein